MLYPNCIMSFSCCVAGAESAYRITSIGIFTSKFATNIGFSYCQDTIFGGFAPNSQTAEQLSKSLGSRTALSGSVSRGKNDPSQSLQMMERPLMTPDELKSIPKGSFVVMKTGTHPMQTKLRLFLDWGITFGEPYATPEHAARPVAYASRQELFFSISKRYSRSSGQPVQAQQTSAIQRRTPRSAMGLYSEDTRP